jgi:alpha-tubulin suppressor-like RCC1 family protein
MRLRTGSVWCSNFTPATGLTPVAVEGLYDAADLGCGRDHCCATRSSGQTVCWGSNSHGQLADGLDPITANAGTGPRETVPRSTVDLLLL